MCALRPQVSSRCGMCLIMADIEPLKPTNTGWLIADVISDTFAFGWARTSADPAMLALLADPRWQPYVVFPGEFVEAARVVTSLNPSAEFPPPRPPIPQKAPPAPASATEPVNLSDQARRPLFVLLDATWPEARKMFRKSPFLERFPVLSLHSEQRSRYRLRRSNRSDHFCTSEVAALCLDLAGETLAAQTLEAYLDVFTTRYLRAKQQLPPDAEDTSHVRLHALTNRPPPTGAYPATTRTISRHLLE